MKKGFTLIELLAVIAVLAVILLIALSYVLNVLNQSKIEAFKNNEKMLLKAASIYLAANQNLIPTINGERTIIDLDDLKSNNFITDLRDSNNNTCSGRVVVYKNNDSLNYIPYLDCNINKSVPDYITSNLILHLDGYTAPVANIWNDKSPTVANATMINMANTNLSGHNNKEKAYVFDGINDYMIINTNNAFISSNTGEFTYSIWLKTDNYNTNQTFLAKTEACNNPGTFEFSTFSNRTYFSFYSNIEPGAASHYSNPVLVNNETYNFVWVKKWGQLGVRLYINGSLVSIIGDSAFRGSTYNSPIFIGARNGDGTTCQSYPYPFRFFRGSIYDIKIYNKLLTEQEITTNYNYDKTKLGL